MQLREFNKRGGGGGYLSTRFVSRQGPRGLIVALICGGMERQIKSSDIILVLCRQGVEKYEQI